jgi:hypothetical protein
VECRERWPKNFCLNWEFHFLNNVVRTSWHIHKTVRAKALTSVIAESSTYQQAFNLHEVSRAGGSVKAQNLTLMGPVATLAESVDLHEGANYQLTLIIA